MKKLLAICVALLIAGCGSISKKNTISATTGGSTTSSTSQTTSDTIKALSSLFSASDSATQSSGSGAAPALARRVIMHAGPPPGPGGEGNIEQIQMPVKDADGYYTFTETTPDGGTMTIKFKPTPDWQDAMNNMEGEGGGTPPPMPWAGIAVGDYFTTSVDVKIHMDSTNDTGDFTHNSIMKQKIKEFMINEGPFDIDGDGTTNEGWIVMFTGPDYLNQTETHTGTGKITHKDDNTWTEFTNSGSFTQTGTSTFSGTSATMNMNFSMQDIMTFSSSDGYSGTFTFTGTSTMTDIISGMFPNETHTITMNGSGGLTGEISFGGEVVARVYVTATVDETIDDTGGKPKTMEGYYTVKEENFETKHNLTDEEIMQLFEHFGPKGEKKQEGGGPQAVPAS